MNEELKSNMPAFEEIKAEYTMRMVQVKLGSPLVPKGCTLHMDRVTPTTQCSVWTYLYEISDPKLAGFCPAKVWSANGDIVALFYATEAVPPANRPFGKGSTYIAAFRVPAEEVIEYNVDARVSIQQTFDDKDGVIYVVSFGQSEYGVIVKETEE